MCTRVYTVVTACAGDREHGISETISTHDTTGNATCYERGVICIANIVAHEAPHWRICPSVLYSIFDSQYQAIHLTPHVEQRLCDISLGPWKVRGVRLFQLLKISLNLSCDVTISLNCGASEMKTDTCDIERYVETHFLQAV